VDFYSARLLLVILVDDRKPRKTNTWDEIVVTFRARDLDHAFTRLCRNQCKIEHWFRQELADSGKR
jgi:hypothetical protein